MNEYFDQLIKIGLGFGAVFQLICIFAVIFFNPIKDTTDMENNSEDEKVHSIFRNHSNQHGKRNRHEKKKRR